MSKLPLIFVLLCLASCSGCATFKGLTAEESAAADMLASTVQVHVQIAASLITAKGEIPVEEGWVGSGVIYAKTSGLTGPVQSRILTAHHVLDAPKPGTKMPSPLGDIRVDAVLMVITTRSGKTCSLAPIAMGDGETEDVATAVAGCDAGAVAPIASEGPPPGAKVYVCGHPQGINTALVTEGFVSGYYDGYLLISAGAYGGNSGGGVFYHGEVVGLLVRGGGTYPLISLSTALTPIHNRIKQSR